MFCLEVQVERDRDLVGVVVAVGGEVIICEKI